MRPPPARRASQGVIFENRTCAVLAERCCLAAEAQRWREAAAFRLRTTEGGGCLAAAHHGGCLAAERQGGRHVARGSRVPLCEGRRRGEHPKPCRLLQNRDARKERLRCGIGFPCSLLAPGLTKQISCSEISTSWTSAGPHFFSRAVSLVPWNVVPCPPSRAVSHK